MLVQAEWGTLGGGRSEAPLLFPPCCLISMVPEIGVCRFSSRESCSANKNLHSTASDRDKWRVATSQPRTSSLLNHGVVHCGRQEDCHSSEWACGRFINNLNPQGNMGVFFVCVCVFLCVFVCLQAFSASWAEQRIFFYCSWHARQSKSLSSGD